MHAIDIASPSLSPHRCSPTSQLPYEPCITFAANQTTTQPHIGSLVADYTARRQHFYGLEISALKDNQPCCVDFNQFLPVLPAFISLVWLGAQYWDVQPIEEVQTLRLAAHLQPHIPVMPHLTAYRMSEPRLDAFLSLNLTNVLAVRGDAVHEQQSYHYSHQLVERARQQRGDTISICVGGYPQGYTNEPAANQSSATNLQHLKQKIAAGADFIITQFCFEPELIVQFINDCRAANITVPIVVGIIVPDSVRTYRILEKITGIQLPAEARAQLRQWKQSPDQVAAYFVQLALKTIQHVLDANVGVYGIHFYSMNRFATVLQVLKELHARGIFTGSSSFTDVNNLNAV